MALRQNRENSASAGKLKRLFNISRNTLKSWFKYFQDVFPQSSKWQRLRGLVPPTISNDELPGSLFWLFMETSKTFEDAIIQCLEFLTTDKKMMEQSFRAEDW